MSTLKLHGILYSPWTYKARWALSWHGIEYRYSEYLMMISKLAMRLRLNRWSTPITVPIGLVDGRVLNNSLDIAQYADEVGAAASLKAGSPEVAQWDQLADECMQLGRFRLTSTYADDPRALKAAVPHPFRRLPGALFLGKMGLRYMRKTYPLDVSLAQVDDRIAQFLHRVREALGGGDYLLSEPSYADITVAATLQIVDPVPETYIPMEPSARPHWGSERLREEFSDVCAWRDRLFQSMNAPQLGGQLVVPSPGG